MIQKDYLFKTIEFSKVDEPTDYIITKLKPMLKQEVYSTNPDKDFLYETIEELQLDLITNFGYDQESLTLLLVDEVKIYYSPLYAISWYVGGLYDFTRTDYYLANKDSDTLLMTELVDNYISGGLNVMGYVLPERVQKLLWEKSINRMRAFIKPASEKVITSTGVLDHKNFKWVKNDYIPINNAIKIPGNVTDNDTYIHFKFSENINGTETYFLNIGELTENDTLKKIGVCCYKTAGAQFTLSNNDYSWTTLNGPASIDLGIFSYYIYLRYTDNKKTGSLSEIIYNHERKRNYYYIGIFIRLTKLNNNTPTEEELNNRNNYIWLLLSNISSNVIRYNDNTTHYFCYIRFSNNKTDLTDNYTSTSKYLAVSCYNSTNNVAEVNDQIYNSVNYYNFITFDQLSDTTKAMSYPIALNGTIIYKGMWIKFTSDSTNGPIYDNCYYYTGASMSIKHRYKYLLLGLDKTDNSEKSNNISDYPNKIDLTLYEDAYSISNYVYNDGNTSKFIILKFSDSYPIYTTSLMSSVITSTSKYIGISITTSLGIYHTNQSNTLDIDDFIWYPLYELAPHLNYFEFHKYFYFTFNSGGINDNDRKLFPTNVDNFYFGYDFDLITPLSVTPVTTIVPDETSKYITLYKASGLNASGEAEIKELVRINIPYTYMGKLAVLNFEPFTLHTGEYLIVGGNRDTTSILLLRNTLSDHTDYYTSNLELKMAPAERPLIANDVVMYYTHVNYNSDHLTDWTPVYNKKLLVDFGCGYVSNPNNITLTSKSYNDYIEATQNYSDKQLEEFKKTQNENGYKAPNYDLYINLTYKFAKIIDGESDYLRLNNHYKIKYKFKNEDQLVLLNKVFDTSLITPDGSIYNKPDYLYDIVNDITYDSESAQYKLYFEFMEDPEIGFPHIIAAADETINDDSYDVAYFQSDNILRELYKTDLTDSNSIHYDANYYNYKYLSDELNKSKLPVLCEICVMAFDTATTIYSKVIPVSLAAYSLVEVTNDYIKTTVTKIENDYIYGLTLRTSKIEQYADKISMSVLNIGQGLYSRMQMTEDKILMEVVDTSKSIGSLFELTAEKILSIVYDTSNNLYSKILLEKDKISLEVANNFKKAGIYLYEDSATIDAPDLYIHGDRTTIYGDLRLKTYGEQSSKNAGLYFYDLDGLLSIEIKSDAVKNLSAEDYMYYSSYDDSTIGDAGWDSSYISGKITRDYTNTIISAGIVIDRDIIMEAEYSFTYTGNTNIHIYPTIKLTVDGNTISFSYDNISYDTSIYKRTIQISEQDPTIYGSRNLIFGAGESLSEPTWFYNDAQLTTDNLTNNVYNLYTTDIVNIYPELHMPSDYEKYSVNITVPENNPYISNLSYTFDTVSEKYVINTPPTLGEGGQVLITASWTKTDQETVTNGELRITMNVIETPDIKWKNGSQILDANTAVTLYIDVTLNSTNALFTNPVLENPDNITITSYTSSNTNIARILANGLIDTTISNLSVGETIISAIYTIPGTSTLKSAQYKLVVGKQGAESSGTITTIINNRDELYKEITNHDGSIDFDGDEQERLTADTFKFITRFRSFTIAQYMLTSDSTQFLYYSNYISIENDVGIAPEGFHAWYGDSRMKIVGNGNYVNIIINQNYVYSSRDADYIHIIFYANNTSNVFSNLSKIKFIYTVDNTEFNISIDNPTILESTEIDYSVSTYPHYKYVNIEFPALISGIKPKGIELTFSSFDFYGISLHSIKFCKYTDLGKLLLSAQPKTFTMTINYSYSISTKKNDGIRIGKDGIITKTGDSVFYATGEQLMIKNKSNGLRFLSNSGYWDYNTNTRKTYNSGRGIEILTETSSWYWSWGVRSKWLSLYNYRPLELVDIPYYNSNVIRKASHMAHGTSSDNKTSIYLYNININTIHGDLGILRLPIDLPRDAVTDAVFFLLPSYDDIPVGFMINITNLQYHATMDDGSHIGWPVKNVYIISNNAYTLKAVKSDYSEYESVFNLHTGWYFQRSVNKVPTEYRRATFIDGYGNWATTISLNGDNRAWGANTGKNQRGIFIWTGEYWKTDLDRSTDYNDFLGSAK